MKTILAAIACAALASPAVAQSSEWQYSLTTYIWATDTGISAETPSGETVEAELSFSDALKELDFALMGTFEARKDKLSLFTDAMYFKLSPTNDTPGPLSDKIRMESQMTVISAYAAYRVYEESNFAVDVAGGLRWADLTSDVTIIGGSLDGTAFSNGDSWVDPVIGLRLSGKLSDKVSASFFADYGGFDGGNSTWQGVVTVGYALNDRWTLRGGYRYMEFNREIDGRDFSMDQSGLLVGATYNF
ncbi:Outer membrane protein beta-barrel domain-containing protein [Gemmobacter aquatilis]|uniref:Outer membrane protein beta-barrel domain-containing protein n=1 Tax=Gemmobacter aquatilis TaxID=933059 RepID=A0A1H7YEM2_9RHOB|nr:outer membrane beta-barrel protein [Gemmobacter aquatilis]SEM44580.1 Outer membrane protein beta-barrel domain-containing protein [Gemmobacter aquatilis]